MISTAIFTGKTPAEDFRAELIEKMKATALELNCPPEQLKCRFTSGGLVEIAKMEPDEMVFAEKCRIRKRNFNTIGKAKGLDVERKTC